MKSAEQKIGGIGRARSVLWRTLGLAAGWWVLSEGIWEDWGLILLTLLSALAVSLALFPAGSWRWRAAGAVKFFPYFIWQSLLGGVDVARRALSPGLPLQPGFLEYRVRVESEAAAVFLAWIMSLLPGTAAVDLRGGKLIVHVLDEKGGYEEKLKELEERVAAVFGCGLEGMKTA